MNTVLNLIATVHLEPKTAQLIIVLIVIAMASKTVWNTWQTLSGK